MEHMDPKSFIVLLGTLSVAYGENISTERARIYYDCLKDIPLDILKEGIYSLLKTRVYPKFPTIGEIRDKCLGENDEEQEAAALKAWQTAITRYHGNGDPQLNETITLAFGGWDKFDETSLENEISDRYHFMKCFKVIAKSKAKDKLLGEGRDDKALTVGEHGPREHSDAYWAEVRRLKEMGIVGAEMTVVMAEWKEKP